MATAVSIVEREHTLAEDLRNSFGRLCASNQMLRKVSMVIGWEGAFLKRHEAWRLLGFESEMQLYAAAGISRANWYRLTRIGEQLHHLPREQFLAMSIENAELLVRAPHELHHDPMMVQAAAQMTRDDYERLLLDRQAVLENTPPSEQMVTWSLKLKRGQMEAVRNKIRDFCLHHHIDDEVYGLELLVAEYSDRQTLVGFLADAVIHLTEELPQRSDDQLRVLIEDHVAGAVRALRTCAQPEGEE